MADNAPMPRLSICVLTYQRPDCLATLLESILAQDCAELEVVVADDASADHTAQVVQAFASRFRKLDYLRQPKNIGIDRNFLACVERAAGEYVWLMGDDDRLRPGAVQAVLLALATWPAIVGLTVGVIDYDAKLTTPTGVRGMPPTQRIADCGTLFSVAVDILGFMSALVITRRHWQTIVAEEPVLDFDNYYLQVYVIGRAVQRFGDWGLLDVPCVDFRSDNDQFLTAVGWFKRLRIDVKAYEQLGDSLFADNSPARRATRQRVFSSHIISRIRNGKSTGVIGFTDGVRTSKLLLQHYGGLGAFWFNALPLLLMPSPVVRILRMVYKRYSKQSGAARARALQETL